MAVLLWLAGGGAPLRSQTFGHHLQPQHVGELSEPLFESPAMVAPDAGKARETPTDNLPLVRLTTGTFLRKGIDSTPVYPSLYQRDSSLLL